MLGSETDGLSNDTRKLQQLIWRVFTRTHGLTLQADAVQALIDRLGKGSIDELNRVCVLIATTYKKQTGTFLDSIQTANTNNYLDRPKLVTASALIELLDDMTESMHAESTGLAKSHIQVITDMPHSLFDKQLKQFVSVTSTSTFSTASDKREMYREQMDLLRHRIQLAAPSLFKELVGVKVAKCLPSQSSASIFGMLSVLEEDQLFIEDGDDSIRIIWTGGSTDNVQSSLHRPNCLTETMFVVAKGTIVSSCMHVSDIICPPILPRSVSRIEQDAKDDLSHVGIAVIGNICLDLPETNTKLDRMFTVFADTNSIPAAIVMTGPFRMNSSTSERQVFEGLARLIRSHPAILQQCKFVFVPSLEGLDFMAPEMMPVLLNDSKSSVAAVALDSLLAVGVDCEIASNPCRLRIAGKEILVLCDNLTRKLEMHNLAAAFFNSTPPASIDAALVILQQGITSPLALQHQSVIWHKRHLLHVNYPPDFLVLVESQSDSSKRSVMDFCQSTSPGNFSTSNRFAVIHPLTDRIDLCRL